MAKTAEVNFQNFIVKAVNKTPMTTDELYLLAQTRKLSLTRNRARDASRPTQYAWQHQLRRDQFNLASAGVIKRTKSGTWATTTATAVKRFLASA
jgi:hypothetical protein